jgi:hypothetical protein
MIKIAPETACMLYVGGILLLLLLTWIFHSRKAKSRDIVKLSTVHTTCEYCGAAYLVESFTAFHRCPHCQCLNKGQGKK